MVIENTKFENRSIVVNGKSFFLCLPKIWANSLGLKKSDPFVVEWNHNDGSLIVRKMEASNDRTERDTGETTTEQSAVD
ncbi:MAG: AbrB/MazE/SpoVT family DNA-binding domain-containing protein [Candidatus Nanoarchaeia archaeon]